MEFRYNSVKTVFKGFGLKCVKRFAFWMFTQLLKWPPFVIIIFSNLSLTFFVKEILQNCCICSIQLHRKEIQTNACRNTNTSCILFVITGILGRSLPSWYCKMKLLLKSLTRANQISFWVYLPISIRIYLIIYHKRIGENPAIKILRFNLLSI